MPEARVVAALAGRTGLIPHGEAVVSVTRGFERGSLVRIYDRQNSDYVVLTEVGDRLIRWASATPINRRYRAAGPTYLEVVELELHVALRDRRETFRGLQLDPSSRRYVGRVVEQESRLISVEILPAVNTGEYAWRNRSRSVAKSPAV